MKRFLLPTIAAFAMSFAFFSCSNEEAIIESPDAQQAVSTRSATGIKNIVYIEVNDVNPLNAGSYMMNGEPFFDYAILFAANIRGSGSNAILHNNPNVQALLDNKDKYIKPLQDKGVKVLLGLLGDHTGLGFANMNAAQIEQFATAVANAVNQYGLDGVDFDDEWAKYGQNGYPSYINGSYANLVTALRNKLPGKTITVFDYGYSNDLSGVTDKIDFGIFSSFNYFSNGTGFGMPNAKYAPYTINFNNSLAARTVKSNAQKVANNGFGAIAYYDLKITSAQTVLNAIAEGAFNSTCTYNGESFPKDY